MDCDVLPVLSCLTASHVRLTARSDTVYSARYDYLTVWAYHSNDLLNLCRCKCFNVVRGIETEHATKRTQ